MYNTLVFYYKNVLRHNNQQMNFFLASFQPHYAIKSKLFNYIDSKMYPHFPPYNESDKKK